MAARAYEQVVADYDILSNRIEGFLENYPTHGESYCTLKYKHIMISRLSFNIFT